MTLGLTSLSTASLTGLAAVLETGGLRLPVGAVAVGRYVSQREVEAAVTALGHLGDSGLSGPQVGQVLRLLAAEREQGQRFRDRLELVWSGPESTGSASRDTAIVVRELFASAERSVLLSSFAVYQGQQVFEVLARRMEEKPDLTVRFFLNIARPHQDQRSDSEITRDFADSFRRDQWAGQRLPEVYFDPRSCSGSQGHGPCCMRSASSSTTIAPSSPRPTSPKPLRSATSRRAS